MLAPELQDRRKLAIFGRLDPAAVSLDKPDRLHRHADVLGRFGENNGRIIIRIMTDRHCLDQRIDPIAITKRVFATLQNKERPAFTRYRAASIFRKRLQLTFRRKRDFSRKPLKI